MIYTVFLFTNQRIFIFCLIGGIEIEEIVGCSMMLFDAAGPQQPRHGPCGRSRLHLLEGPVTFVMVLAALVVHLHAYRHFIGPDVTSS